jgi:hypothetical protein
VHGINHHPLNSGGIIWDWFGLCHLWLMESVPIPGEVLRRGNRNLHEKLPSERTGSQFTILPPL